MILEDVFKFNNMLMVQCLVDLDLCDQLDYGFFTFCLALDRFKELLAIILAAETRLVSRLVISQHLAKPPFPNSFPLEYFLTTTSPLVLVIFSSMMTLSTSPSLSTGLCYSIQKYYQVLNYQLMKADNSLVRALSIFMCMVRLSHFSEFCWCYKISFTRQSTEGVRYYSLISLIVHSFWNQETIGGTELDSYYKNMYYKVELICQHAPHQCRCRHNIATEVTTEDLTANLIRCNPGLLKYIGRNNASTNRQPQANDLKVEVGKNGAQMREEKPYRSIVEEKGLNFILKDDAIQRPNIPPSLNKKRSEPTLHLLQNQPIIQQPHPQSKSPSPHNPPKPHAESNKQKQVKQYHKQLKNQSRYLSNTAFRKYFDRQCFQNYGNQNVHHKADGFVYGNYLKTYNINPHSGQNMPSNEETFYHALVTASPQKYALQTQEVKLGHTSPHKQPAGKKEEVAKHSLERDKLDVEKMLQDNMKHSKLEKKYDHLKLKPNEKNKAEKQRAAIKSEGKPKLKTNNYISSQNIDSRYSPKELQLQSRKYIGNINPNANSNASIQQQISPKRAESILIQPQPLQTTIKPPTNKSSCNHKEGEQSTECECCLNQMKALILTLADNDPDLASRIVASAKKATLYKNFALNNYDTAALNPHNYRSDGRLNVYEP